MKKHLSMILALLILFALPVSAFAALEQVGGVYQISTSKDLGLFRNMVNAGSGDLSAKLTEHIDLEGKPWTPIGQHVIEGNTYADYSYRGTFDGGGFRVKNLTVTEDDLVAVWIFGREYPSAGLFGVLSSDARVFDLSIEGVTIDVPEHQDEFYILAGAVAGVVLSGDIQNCTVQSADISSGGDAGGIVGYNEDGTIQDCIVQSADISAGDDAGGVVGRNYGNIQNCTVTVETITGDWNAGGIVGYNDGDIQSCTVQSADINAKNYAGGVAGYNEDGTIQTCTVTSGTITGYNAGGVAGYNEDGTIQTCTVTSGTITGYNAGGVAGVNYGWIQNCIVTGASTTADGYYAYSGGVVGYNSGNIQNCTVQSADISAGNSAGNSAEDDAAGGVAGYNWNGNIENCNVTGGTITGSVNAGGVAGYNGGGTIQTCTVKSSLITGARAGGAMGYNRGAIQNCAVFGVTISADAKGRNGHTGAIAGWLGIGGDIQNCVAMDGEKTSVSASADGIAYAGGALGYMYPDDPGSITYTYYPAGIVNTSGIFSAQGDKPHEWAIGNVPPASMDTYGYKNVTSYDAGLSADKLPIITAILEQGIAVTIAKGVPYELDITTLPGTSGDVTCAWSIEGEDTGILTIDPETGLQITVTGVELGEVFVKCNVTGLPSEDGGYNNTLDLSCRVTVVEATTPSGGGSSSNCNSGVGAALFALAGLFLVGKRKK